MSHHRTYDETYKDQGGRVGKEEEKSTASSSDQSINPKFGDHNKAKEFFERGTQGNGDQLERHQVIGSMDKKDKALVHDVLMGDEKVQGGMDYCN